MEHMIRSFDGIKLWCRYIKNDKKKPTLVFIHGLGANWTLWKEEMHFFEKKGYSTLSFDLRGHGLSEVPQHEEDYFFPNFSRDIHHIIEKHHIKKFILIGHSFGGGIAINYTGLFKQHLPKQLILVETGCRYSFKHHREFNVNPLISTILRYIAEHERFRKRNFPHMKDLDLTKIKNKTELAIFLRAIEVTPLKSIIACLDALQEYLFNHVQETERFLTRLKIPTLIIAGSEDTVIPLPFSEELHWLIKNSKLKVIMGVHHRIPLEKPKQLEQEILKFVEHGLIKVKDEE